MVDNSHHIRTLAKMFEQQALKQPQHLSISDGKTYLTYQDVNEKSNQLARYLQMQGVTKNAFIGILLHPGIDFIINILAIVKANATYVPLDVQIPDLRLFEILDEIDPTLIITNSVNLDKVKKRSFKAIDVDLLMSLTEELPTTNIDSTQLDDDPCYMMYTSGTTGKPKGIVIPHRAVINLVSDFNYGGISSSDCVAQFSNLAFDASTFEVWGAWLNGAALFIVPPSIRVDHKKLQCFLTRHSVNYLFLPTAYFHQLIKLAPESLESIDTLIIGGEQCNAPLVNQFLSSSKTANLPITLINGYGPTEATTFTCQAVFNEEQLYSDDRLNTIGQPISNVKTYILDENQNCVAPGRIGELYISGINLALGYYNDSQLNEMKFLPNPFCQDAIYKRLYRTGDLVKELQEGDLRWIGRSDDQVKIRGFRVNSSEIEDRLISHPKIHSAVVVVEECGLTKSLVAYIRFSSEKTVLSSKMLSDYLAQYLPSYMLPSKYIQINEFPLTSMGKVNRKKLPFMQGKDLSTTIQYHAVNSVEKKLNEIWSKLLSKESIDVTKNFFELGADSLTLIQACDQISKKLHFQCDISTIIQYPSIRKMRCYFDNMHQLEKGEQHVPLT